MTDPKPAAWNRKDDLAAMWKNAKKEAESKAKAKKETDQLAKFRKDKMKDDLTKALEAWPKHYPKVDKLDEGKKKLDKIMQTYQDALKACTTLDDEVKKPLKAALTNMKIKLGGQMADAKLAAVGANTDVVKALGAPQMQGLGPGKKLSDTKKPGDQG